MPLPPPSAVSLHSPGHLAPSGPGGGIGRPGSCLRWQTRHSAKDLHEGQSLWLLSALPESGMSSGLRRSFLSVQQAGSSSAEDEPHLLPTLLSIL